MNSPATAILWQLWWRNRWGLSAIAAYLALLIVLVHGMPTLMHVQLFGPESPPLGICLALPCIWLSIGFLAVFTFASVDTREAGLPRHMFLLPVATRTLVLWPMFYGCVVVALYWLIVAYLVIRPLGAEGSLWWAVGPIALGMAVSQALSWAPLAQSWLRTLVAAPVLFILVSAMAIWLSLEYSKSALATISLAILPLVIAAALAGVARARRGDVLDWRIGNWISAGARWRLRAARPPFSSKLRAQLWFECRGLAWRLPSLVLAMLICATFLLLSNRHDLQLTWRLVGGVLFLPALTARIMGVSLGRQDASSKYRLPAFAGTRPLTCGQMVRVKFAMAGISALAAYAIVALYLPLALLVRGGAWQAVADTASRLPAWKTIGIPAAAFFALVLVAWSGLIDRLWLGLTGRTWLINAFGAAAGALSVTALIVAAWIFYFHPEWHATVKACVPWVLVALLVIKLATVVGVFRGLLRSQLARPSDVPKIAGLWALVVAAECAVVRWLAPSELISLPMIIGSVALLTPLSRLAAAPLALKWNRHR